MLGCSGHCKLPMFECCLAKSKRGMSRCWGWGASEDAAMPLSFCNGSGSVGAGASHEATPSKLGGRAVGEVYGFVFHVTFQVL